jgi:hypothetical protein
MKMKKELLEKLNKVELFFTQSPLGRQLNATEEILMTIVQLLDIRDEELVSDELFNRMVKKLGMGLLHDEMFYEEYTVMVGLFIESMMEDFYTSESEDLHGLMMEVGEVFASSLSKIEFELLVMMMIDKMKLISKNKTLMDEDKVALIVTEFIKPNYKDELLKRDKKEVVAVLLGVTLSMVSFLALAKMEDLGLDEDVVFDDSLSLESAIRAGFKETPSDEKVYNLNGLAYPLGTKAICNLCDKEYVQRGLKRHLNSCVEKSYKVKEEELYYLVLKGDSPDYYLHIAVKSYGSLSDLDSYLRDVWLECCGHMSEFFVGRNVLDMSMTIGEAFNVANKLEYIYDFGSSTYIYVEFVKTFKGKQSTIIETLARNPMPKIKCSSCGSLKVVAVCGQCLYDAKGNLCKKCLPQHECGLDMVLPYVNSPRYGECGYGEWSNTHNFSEKEFDKIYEEVEGDG